LRRGQLRITVTAVGSEKSRLHFKGKWGGSPKLEKRRDKSGKIIQVVNFLSRVSESPDSLPRIGKRGGGVVHKLQGGGSLAQQRTKPKTLPLWKGEGFNARRGGGGEKWGFNRTAIIVPQHDFKKGGRLGGFRIEKVKNWALAKSGCYGSRRLEGKKTGG